jgi:hypothetical protein
MGVHLQAVSMLAEMLNARVERGLVAGPDLQTGLSRLNLLAREAMMSCLQVTGWIDWTDDETIELRDGVDECVQLLSASLAFRGFTLVNEVGLRDFPVQRAALRCLLAGVVIALADESPAPGELVIQADMDEDRARLAISGRVRPHPAARTLIPAPETDSQPSIDWDELGALALAEGVVLDRQPGGVCLRLRRAVVTSPLQMAPV